MSDPDIRHDIERTRRELGDTAEALAYKANVPARSKEKLAAAKTKVAEQAQQKIDNLPEPAAQRARGLIEAVQKRPGAFLAGALMSIVVLRKITRRRRQS